MIKVLSRWKFGILAATAMTILALMPQLTLWHLRGKAWNGSYASFAGDEDAYSSYVNALIDGRPRRNDPYTGRDDTQLVPQPESLFSIQFAPAYAIALPARAFGFSASTAFILLTCLATFAATLALFWFLLEVLGDQRIASAATVVVLCLGSLAPLQIALQRLLMWLEPAKDFSGLYVPLGFMRRYLPAAPFPLFFVFCLLVWKLVERRTRHQWKLAVLAGITFDLLIFSYVYLWTAALVWLLLIALLWSSAKLKDWQRALKRLGVIIVFAIVGLIPYFILLRNRAPMLDQVSALARTHAPDLFRSSELIGFLTIVVLAVAALRGRIEWRRPQTLVAMSFSALPFALFNQQIVTGHVLQPFHYDAFITNYTALIAVVLALAMLAQKSIQKSAAKTFSRLLWLVAIAAFCCAAFEMNRTYKWQSTMNVLVDEAAPVARQIAAQEKQSLRAQNEPRGVVFVKSALLADWWPTFAPQGVLWAPRMIAFSGANGKEIKERYFCYLYYSSVTEAGFRDSALRDAGFLREIVFGVGRAQAVLNANEKPVTNEDIEQATQEYSRYIASFDRARAAEPALSYVIGTGEDSSEFTNLDRWYERDKGERIGEFRLYRVSLKP